jgi:hypothetical protein
MSIDKNGSSTPSTVADVRQGTRQPTIGTHARSRARHLAEEFVLMVRAASDLTIVVDEGDHQTQYRRVISPSGRRKWVRVADGDSPHGISGTFTAPEAAHDAGDDVTPVWVDAIGKNRVIEELLDVLAAEGHPLRDELPEIERTDTEPPAVRVCPIRDAPELPVSPQRAFENVGSRFGQ